MTTLSQLSDVPGLARVKGVSSLMSWSGLNLETIRMIWSRCGCESAQTLSFPSLQSSQAPSRLRPALSSLQRIVPVFCRRTGSSDFGQKPFQVKLLAFRMSPTMSESHPDEASGFPGLVRRLEVLETAPCIFPYSHLHRMRTSISIHHKFLYAYDITTHPSPSLYCFPDHCITSALGVDHTFPLYR